MDAHLKTEIGQASWRLKCAMDTLKEARDAGIEALEIFKRDVEDAQLGLINARLKLESDLDVARVEVGHAMGVHTRAKAALMAGLGKKNIENSRSKMGFVTRSIPRSPSNTSLFKYPIGRSVLPHHLLVFSFDPFNIFNRRNYDREGVSL